MAVLRRPQTPTDVLPPYALISRSSDGTIIPSLTRLVATVPGAELFIVVTTPAPGSPPLWSPELGDQAAIVAVTPQGSTESPGIPAVDLTNADEVVAVGVTGLPGHASATDAYDAAIVPDGVAKVRWTFGDIAGKPERVVNAPAANNVAVVPFGSGLLLRGTWYASSGDVIPTSDEPVLRAIAARQAVLSARIIRYDATHSYSAPPALLADFAVFAVTSRTGVRTAAGNIISHPRLSTVPYGILAITRPRQPAVQTDPEDMRQVTTPSGAQVWITPARQGMCLAALQPSRLPDGLGGGSAAEGCSGTVADAKSYGAGFGSCCVDGVGTTYQVVPKSRTITIRTRRGTRKTFYPPDGVYVGQSG
ncbi:MAG: hypothetical protein ACLP8S_06525 [Solirubrobacteraceae bacterium]